MAGVVGLPRRFLLSDGVVAREDPVWFASRFLGVRAWRKQREVLRALRDHDLVAVRSCNGSGKTFTAALATLWWLCAHDADAMVITTAPSERQVKELLWREIRHLYGKNPELLGGKLTSTRLELSEKRFAYGFSTDTAGRFQGFHSENILVIVDEAAEVREFIFDAIYGCLTSENAKMLMIGNPSRLAGTFYDAFHKNRGRWKTIHISAFDTPAFRGEGPLCPSDISPAERGKEDPALHPSPPPSRERGSAPPSPHPGHTPAFASLRVPFRGAKGDGTTSSDASGKAEVEVVPAGLATPKWAEMIADQRGVNSSEYQFRVLGEFPEEADDTLIALRLIESAVGREFEGMSGDDAVMGVDVARFGDNQTVAVVRRGSAVIDMLAFGRSDLMGTTGRVIDMARRHGVKAMHVDEVGLGAAVVDRARELDSVRTIGVNGGSKASDSERYLNLRAEMYDGLRQRFADGDISIPDDSELASQLASLTFSYTSRGQLQIEGKDRIRSSGRQSPDKADALALAFAKDVEANPLRLWVLSRDSSSSRSGRRRRTRVRRDWWE